MSSLEDMDPPPNESTDQTVLRGITTAHGGSSEVPIFKVRLYL